MVTTNPLKIYPYKIFDLKVWDKFKKKYKKERFAWNINEAIFKLIEEYVNEENKNE